ncbi:MAG: anti-sigma factor [Betaproteobacteria bacterium]
MRLAAHRLLDALCGEYLLGTLRGAARRRFARALAGEPEVALRLRSWERSFLPRYSPMIEIQPSRAAWRRLEQELGLAAYRTPWHARVGLLRGWAVAASAAALIGIGLVARQPAEQPRFVQVAELAAQDAAPVTAHLSRERATLELRSARPVLAGPQQSYELWLIPAEGGAPVSLAVLGSLDARFTLARAHAARLRAGAALAISVEPAGGSPSGKPTGPVIRAGKVTG